MSIVKRNDFPEPITCLSRSNVFWIAFAIITSRATTPEALLSFHVTLLGKTFDPSFAFPVFPNFVFVVIIRSTWVVRLGRIPHYQLLYILILILDEISLRGII